MVAVIEAVYTTEATSTGAGRDGHVKSSDGFIDQPMRHPTELGGPGGATNPEQLFAAAYASCFLGAIQLVGRQQKRAVPKGTTVTAAVGIGPNETSFAIDTTLTAHLPGLDQEEADELVAAAHEVCPYSKATRGNVEVRLVAKT